MKRRPFLQIAAAAAGQCALGLQTSFSAEQFVSNPHEEIIDGVPHRVLGRTGEKIPTVGFPGLALVHYDQDYGTQELHRAVDRGFNYFDVAPAYGNGEAEIKMGIGLKNVKRDKFFLACKTKARDKEGARKELERSLERLKTDHFDLYQLHHLRTTAEVEEAFGPGGAMETILKAKEEGKVRFIGFSSHTTVSALAVMKKFKFDTVMFPINFVEYYSFGFGKEVLDLANEQGAAVLAIKTLSGGLWPQGVDRVRNWWYRTLEDQNEIDLATRFTLSLKSVVSGIPPSFIDLFNKTITAVKRFHPITKTELEEAKKLAENCPSVFKSQQQVSFNSPHQQPLFAGCPYSQA